MSDARVAVTPPLLDAARRAAPLSGAAFDAASVALFARLRAARAAKEPPPGPRREARARP